MRRVLFPVMAVAVYFSAPSFAGEERKDQKDEKKGGHVVVLGDEKKDAKDEKEGGGHLFCFDEGRIDPFRTTVLP